MKDSLSSEARQTVFSSEHNVNLPEAGAGRAPNPTSVAWVSPGNTTEWGRGRARGVWTGVVVPQVSHGMSHMMTGKDGSSVHDDVDANRARQGGRCGDAGACAEMKFMERSQLIVRSGYILRSTWSAMGKMQTARAIWLLIGMPKRQDESTGACTDAQPQARDLSCSSATFGPVSGDGEREQVLSARLPGGGGNQGRA